MLYWHRRILILLAATTAAAFGAGLEELFSSELDLGGFGFKW